MSNLSFLQLGSVVLFLAASGTHLWAEPPAPQDVAFFESKIRPALVKYCFECHSTASKEVGGKLLLDSQEAMLQGGVSGPALVAGKPAESLLIKALHYEDLAMPPKEPLPEPIIRDFEAWIERGAADPRRGQPIQAGDKAYEAEAVWSFLPRQQHKLPQVQHNAWPRDPVDLFLLSRIEAAGLQPNHDAPPRTLIRRLFYDLIGLPPTPSEVEQFVAAWEHDAEQAVARCVDELLARPQYGQRWGRHWLDVARFAESNGDDGLGRNPTYPHAWRYRDYVVAALNGDVPYDRFLTEQIAGDLLPAHSAEERNRLLVATGFLAVGYKPAAAMNNNFAMDIVDDQIDTISTAVMGLSVACARCHDHKHDPIPTADYYALAGIFSSTETLYGLAANEKLTAPPTPLHELKSVWNAPSAEQAANPGELKFPANYVAEVEKLQPAFVEPLNQPPTYLTSEQNLQVTGENFAAVKDVLLRGNLPTPDTTYSVAFWFKNELQHQARPITAYLFSRARVGDGSLPGDHLGIGGNHEKEFTGNLFVFNGNQAKQKVTGATKLTVGSWNHIVMIRDGARIQVYLNGSPEPEIDGELPATFGSETEFSFAARSDKFAPLQGNVAGLAVFSRALNRTEANKLYDAADRPDFGRTLGLAMGARDKQQPADCKIHVGGETGKQGAVVPRGFLSAYARLQPEHTQGFCDSPLPVDPHQSGRLQLAQWLTHPDHPQTARVIVNRVWLHLFGQGLVTTPDDFGVYGARPEHPELLDHLAEQFVREGWSLKKLIRKLVLTHAYQLDSRCSEELFQADPNNRLVARHQRQRLDAEALRDSILFVSDQLDLNPGIGSAIEKIDKLINWPPGEATNLHRPSRQRSIYLCQLRHAPPPEIAPFDLPSGVDGLGQRSSTILPTHALYMLNSPVVVENAAALVQELLAQADLNDRERATALFERFYQRPATAEEVTAALQHLQVQEQSLSMSIPDSEQRLRAAWASLCQAIIASNEFRFVD